MAAYSDFLQTPVGGVLTPTIGVYVQLVSNNTALGYVSDTATDTKGKFTFNTKPPGDMYTVYTNIAHLAPLDAGWTLAGDAAYAVPYVAGDNAALGSATALASSPYTPTASPGRIAVGATFAALASMASTVFYVDATNGLDTNDGKSEGYALQTLGKAISTLNLLNTVGGRIVVLSSFTNLDQATPLHCFVPVLIEGMTPWAATVRRTFSTPSSRSVWDAVTTAAGTTVTSATAAFVAGDTGRIAMIYGAGTGGGTYYGFLTQVNGTTCNLSGPTAIARNATTDPKGVKLTVAGSWNRKVTDAGIVATTSVVASATAAWTNADVGTELVIDGAGHNGQALRSVIISVSGNNATILGKATTTVTNKTCAIGVNFGHLITFHTSYSGIRNVQLIDQTTGNGSIGSALALYVDEGANGNGACYFEDFQITSSDAAGAWEHVIDFDGSWAQAAGGPGIRSVGFFSMELFGARKAQETVRFNSLVHGWLQGGGVPGGDAPTAIRQGVTLLDPQKTAGGSHATVDVNFGGSHALGDYYCEGQYCNVVGGSWGGDVGGPGKTCQFAAAADSNSFIASDRQTTDTTSDLGTNNIIYTQYHASSTGQQLLGLGIGAPLYNVDVKALGTTDATFRLATASGWGSVVFRAAGNTPGDNTLLTQNATALKLGTNGVAALGIDTAGHLSHLIVGAPATSALGANVTSVTFTGNDRRGTIAIVMAGALAANTRIATCTYAASYGTSAPFVFLINETSGAGLVIVNFYRQAVSTGVSFDLACNQALAAGTYTVAYLIEG